VPLQHSSPTAELSLATDASDTHIGGVMQQKPSWLKVDKAIIFFISNSPKAEIPAIIIVIWIFLPKIDLYRIPLFHF
jgi:hypothetical protein